jgi:hypothetical protein
MCTGYQAWNAFMSLMTDTSPSERRQLLQQERKNKVMLPKAFVTFKTYAAATLARQVRRQPLRKHQIGTQKKGSRGMR